MATPAKRKTDGTLPLRVWLALYGNVRRIEGRIQTGLRDGFASTLPRFDLLSQLYRAPDGLTMGELSSRLMVSNGNVTGLTARLVGERLVGRIPDPRDKRVQRVSLTAKGKQEFESMIPANQQWVAEAMAGLTGAELNQLLALLQKMKLSGREKACRPPAAKAGNSRGRLKNRGA